jgi:hypothetical protein
MPNPSAEYPRIQFNQTQELKRMGRPRIIDEDTLGGAAKRDLMRYYALLQHARTAIADRWSARELGHFFNTLNEYGWPQDNGHFLLMKADPELTELQALALFDALEGVRAGSEHPGAVAFVAAGLLSNTRSAAASA